MDSVKLALGAAVLGLLATPAEAHFVWARVTDGNPRKLEVTFGERPEEPTTDVPISKLAAMRAKDGTGKALTLAATATSLACDLAPDARIATASQGWGVVDRTGDGTGAFLLEYSAKAVPSIGDAGASGNLLLEVFARRDGGDVVATVKKSGAPLPEASLQICILDEKPHDRVTDAKGEVRFAAPASGLCGLRARWIEPRAGEAEGKKFGEVRHYSTLSFELGGAAKEASAPRAGKAAADPEAYALLKAAHDRRQVMPPDYAGFRANLVLSEGDKTWKGTLVYRKKGETDVALDGVDEESSKWVRQQILNLVGHRRGGDFAEGDGKYPLELGPDDANAFGRLILVNDKTDSKYRVKDDTVMEVTRTMEGSTFTISVVETKEADAGKYLANHFIVSYRDPESGALQKMDGYRDSYAHVGDVWLPTSRTVISVAESTSPRIRNIRLLAHAHLPAEETAVR